MTTALISYARADKVAAQLLAKELERRGVTVAFPESLVSPGDSWVSKLQTAIDNCDLVFTLISKDEPPEFVKIEQSIAIALSEERGRPRVVPVLLSPKVDVPFMLRSVQGIAFYDEQRLQGQLDRLVETIAKQPSRTADEAAQAHRAELDYIRASKEALARERVRVAEYRAVRSSMIAAVVGAIATGGMVVALGILAVKPVATPGSVLLFGLGALTGIAAAWFYSRWLKPLFHDTETE